MERTTGEKSSRMWFEADGTPAPKVRIEAKDGTRWNIGLPHFFSEGNKTCKDTLRASVWALDNVRFLMTSLIDLSLAAALEEDVDVFYKEQKSAGRPPNVKIDL